MSGRPFPHHSRTRRPRTTSDLLPLALAAELGALDGKTTRGDATKLGGILRKLRDQVLALGPEHGHVKITQPKTRPKSLWRLVGGRG